MMKLKTPLISGILITSAAAGIALVSTSATDARSMKRGEPVQIKEIGEPKSCINRSQIRSTRVIDDRTIDFTMRGGKIYRNKLPNKCSGLAFEDAFSYSTSTNRLCNVDIIRVLDQTAGRIDTRGACGLGKFQEIEKIIPEKKSGE